MTGVGCIERGSRLSARLYRGVMKRNIGQGMPRRYACWNNTGCREHFPHGDSRVVTNIFGQLHEKLEGAVSFTWPEIWIGWEKLGAHADEMGRGGRIRNAQCWSSMMQDAGISVCSLQKWALDQAETLLRRHAWKYPNLFSNRTWLSCWPHDDLLMVLSCPPQRTFE